MLKIYISAGHGHTYAIGFDFVIYNKCVTVSFVNISRIIRVYFAY